MLVMEKSVDDALIADFAGFNDGCASTEGGIASAATVACGDWEGARRISTDNGDMGELIDFLADSSTESQQIVDCILNEHIVYILGL